MRRPSTAAPFARPHWWKRLARQVRANVGARARHHVDDTPPDAIDEAGEESFPASDPPSWTLGVEPRRAH